MDITNLCRCCLSQGALKDLYSSYVWLDKNETYSDMLRECFNIVLSASDRSNICETCVTQLRSSMHFKQQVLDAEQQFVRRLQAQDNDNKGLVEVKLEPKQDSGDDSDDYFLSDAVREIKEEAKEVRSKREVKARRKCMKSKPRRALSTTLDSSVNSCTTPDIPKLNQIHDDTIKKETANLWSNKTEKLKHKENLKTILQYSNVVPFKNKSLLGFVCGYCDVTSPDPEELRIHTEKVHKLQRLEFKSNFDMTEYNVKVDVSGLKCTLCDEQCDGLNEFKRHVVKVHKKIIYNDIKDHIMQFKLKKGDVFDCALCSNTYETFKMLLQHMNKHYANYACNTCNTAFATKRSLNSHKTTHQDGSHKCLLCDKIFSSKAKQHYHEKTKHLGARSISNCPYCNEAFRSYYQRNQHLVKVHNAEAQYKCNVCNKSYILKSLLMYHIKKTHLMERNYQCNECGYKFFSKKALNAHMVKHTGERNYKCEVCHKSYARKYTLREHMRIHNNDRRFRCEVCPMTFVQKCSLKSHLLSNHGISMAAREITSS